MKLSDPTPQTEIKTRQGPGGRMLSYVDARFVMERLDAAVGPEHWQDRYEDRTDGSVRCGIGIKFGDEWIWKWDAGDPSDIEATKGVHSDAFKRAGVKWGIGRDLYGDHPAPRPPQAPRTAAVPSAPLSAPSEDVVLAEARALFADDIEHETADSGGPMLDQRTAQRLLGVADESKCPDHHKEWRQNSKGYYCATKVGDGWCQRRPSKAWQAAQELVPA